MSQNKSLTSLKNAELDKCAGGSKRPVYIDNSLHIKNFKNTEVIGGKTIIINNGSTPGTVVLDDSVHVENCDNVTVTGNKSLRITTG